jgi:hypothetical protein
MTNQESAPRKPRAGQAAARASTREILLDTIRVDGDTQPREAINQEVVDEYAQGWEDRISYPPVDAVLDGENYWLWDGFHRCLGARKAGRARIRVRVTRGTLEDARWLALGANRTHGLHRSNADKRRSVERALAQRPAKSNRRIAEHCGVSLDLVNRVRREMEATERIVQSPLREGDDGRVIDTSNIGGVTGDPPDEAASEPPAAAPQPRDDDASDEGPSWEDRLDPAAVELLEEHDKNLPRRQLERLSEVPQAAQFDVAFLVADGQADTVAAAIKRYEESINPDVPCDPAGLPVSGDAVAVLQTLALYREALLTGRKLADLIHQIAVAPGGHFLRGNLRHRGRDPENLRHHSTDLDQVLTELKCYQPYCSACPYCHHAHPGKFAKNCEACHGVGWVTKHTFDASPPGYREAVLKGATR